MAKDTNTDHSERERTLIKQMHFVAEGVKTLPCNVGYSSTRSKTDLSLTLDCLSISAP